MRTIQFGSILVCLLAGHAILLLADFIAPYDFAEQFREVPFAPPTAIHFIDNAGTFHWRPFVSLPDSTVHAASISFLVPGSSYRILGIIPCSVHLFGVREPAHIFLFGSDAYGRDQFSRFLAGGQLSVAVGWLAAFLTLSIGTLAGLFAGFYGGWGDNLLMRGSELFLALPWIYMLLGIRALLPLAISSERVLFLLIAVIGILGWARPARMVRGVVMSAKTFPFVLAAGQFGASGRYLMWRHLIPETYGVLLAQAALLIPQYIAAEVTLSFLGLGISEPMSSWGTMLSAMRDISVVSSYWWMAIPAIVLIPFFLFYQLFAQSVHRLTVKEG